MKQIPLRARDGSIRAHALVDDEDYEWLMQWRWYQHSGGYAATKAMGPRYMHREVGARMLGRALAGGQVHHGPGGILDNRRANLTVCANQLEHKAQHFEHPGVRFDGERNEWYVRLTIDGRLVWLGSYATKEEALEVSRTRERPPREPSLGVCFHKQSGRWLAYLDPKPRRYLGLHPTRDAAIAVVEEARRATT